MNRRTLCKSFAASTLMYPFLSMLGQAPARAGVGNAKYLLLLHTPGTDPAAWRPGNYSDSGVAFSEMTSPLASIADELILIDNLSSFGTADNHTGPGGLTGRMDYGNGNVSVLA